MNYRHLHYFWCVARAGSLARAADLLDVTPQTLSEQLRQFERSLGKTLFTRAGRGLTLTESGRLVFGYAAEMFALGEALETALERGETRQLLYRVGVSDLVSKTIAYRLLEPAVRSDRAVRLACREGAIEDLLAQLAANRLDLVLAESPMPETASLRAYNHLLGQCGTTIFGHPSLVARHRGRFPACLDSAPLLLPEERSPLRARLLRHFGDERIAPNIVGEFDDSALMKSFGQAGIGFFPGPTAIADEISRQYDVRAVGEFESVTMSFYAISVERRLTHPMNVLVARSARQELFGT